MKKTRSDQQERKKYHHFHAIMDGSGKDWAKLRPQANVHTLASTVMPSSLMRPGRSQTQQSVRYCVCVMCACGACTVEGAKQLAEGHQPRFNALAVLHLCARPE